MYATFPSAPSGLKIGIEALGYQEVVCNMNCPITQFKMAIFNYIWWLFRSMFHISSSVFFSLAVITSSDDPISP